MLNPCPDCGHAVWSEVRRVGAFRFVVYFEDERTGIHAQKIRTCPECGADLADRGGEWHGFAPRLRLPQRGRKPHPGHAVDALLETVGRYPGEVELVTLGPLTNVAMALHRDPSYADKVKGCVMMCGSSDHLGNMTAVAEYNAWADPEAAKVVFSSGMPLKMVGLDVSRKHASFAPEEAAELRGVGTPLAEFCVDFQRVVLEDWDGGSSLRTR